jgi:thioredoxin-like negative regulator of GroEL
MRDRRQQDLNGGQQDGQNPPPAGPMRQYEMMKQYLDLVDRYAAVARDPTNAGIAAVVAAVDTLRPRGSDAAIDYFNKLLPDVKDQAVARAIKAQLADLYRQSGQQDKALDELKGLIVNPNGDAGGGAK